MKIEWNKVTRFSQILAIIIFVGVFFVGFVIGKKYESNVSGDYKNISYDIETIPMRMGEGGMKYFGNLAKGDFNRDGIPDLAFIVTLSPGGSGTFYYVVAALQNIDGDYKGTNGILLGDRIAPQTTEFRDGEIIVNYADRGPKEPMTTAPSVGVSKYLKVVDGKLVEVK